MHKLVARWMRPADPTSFAWHYADVCLPPAHAIAVPARLAVKRAVPSPWGRQSTGELIAEPHPLDRAPFEAALRSSESRAVGQDVRQFAGDLATPMTVSET